MDIVNEILKIRPVTRFLCLSFFGVSIPVFMSLVSAYYVVYTNNLVFNRWQLWRLYTSFFLGAKNISYIFDMAMLYRAGNEIEGGAYSAKSGDLAWQMFWAGACIIGLSIPLQGVVFFRPLLHCLVYLSSSLAPAGAQTSIFGLITIPVLYFPYVLLGFELLGGGPGAVALCLPGTVTGHLWWWSIWGSAAIGGRGGFLEEWGRAPQWVARWFRDVPGPVRGANQGPGVYVTAPRQFATSARTTGSSGTASGSGGQYNWGSGQRLGSS